MNTTTSTIRSTVRHHDPVTGRFTALLVVTDLDAPAMPMREPDFHDEEGQAVWMGPRAAVCVEGGQHRIREILGQPRLTEFVTEQGTKGWSRVPVSTYGAIVSKFPGYGTDDDVPTAEESWDLLAEAVSL